MDEFAVVIVGAGPRGLSLLERLWALHRATKPKWRLHVTILDPAEPGQGVHSASQPPHFYANTVAGQITLFTDSSLRDAGPIVEGPTLLEWAKASGYRKVEDTFIRTVRDGAEIQENDYLPRSLLGEYLTHVFDLLARECPSRCRLSHTRRAAIDVLTAGDKVEVVLDGGHRILADCIVLTTGHAANLPSVEEEILVGLARSHRSRNPKLAFFPGVSPIDQLRSIDAGAEVCIQGIGLTAYDIISHLSIGRGGRHTRGAGGTLAYAPSGREPRMTITSRQGIPFSARAVNQKGLDGLHRPRFFTRQFIDELRLLRVAECGDGRLDFERDLWPVLLKEMAFAYDLSARRYDATSSEEDVSVEARTAVAKLLQPLVRTSFADQEEFSNLLRSHLEEDLLEAGLGNVTSPVKAAADVLRDTRDYIRYAVDHRGLTEASHRRFNDIIVPLMYRISAGAPRDRNAELCSLMDAGLLRFGPGPMPLLTFNEARARFELASTSLHQAARQSFDVVVRARIDSCIDPERQTSELFANMVRRGFARAHRNGSYKPGGIDVDDQQRIVDGLGRVHANVWALGIVVEGANFCTYVLPRVFVNSRFLQFSGKCAAGIFGNLGSRWTSGSQAAVRSDPPLPPIPFAVPAVPAGHAP